MQDTWSLKLAARQAASRYLIRGARLLTMDPSVKVPARSDLRIRDGLIAEIGVDLPVDGAHVIEARGMIAMPGLVDTHWHLWTSALRNLVGDDAGSDYYRTKARFGPHFRPADTHAAVKLGLTEALMAGITTVHDWAHNIRSPEHADADLQAYLDVGLRGRFSYGASEGQAADRPMDLPDLARVQRSWFNGAQRAGPLSLGVALRGPFRSALEVYRAECESAFALGLPISVHAGTSEEEVRRVRVIDVLARDRLLRPGFQVVHGTRTTPGDLALLAASGGSLSLSPISEMRARMGIPPVAAMLRAGVPLSVSVDTLALSGTADLFLAARLVHDLARNDGDAESGLTTAEALELLTLGGARTLGLEDQIGSLTPGKRADVILLRSNDVNAAPVADAATFVLHAATPRNVDTVIVDGRPLLALGRPMHVNTESVVRDASQSLDRLAAAAHIPSNDEGEASAWTRSSSTGR